MIIDVKVEEIEEYKTREGKKYHRIVMLEDGKGAIRQFMGWSVADEYKRDIQHLKEGSKAKMRVKNISSNYDGSLKIQGELVSQ